MDQDNIAKIIKELRTANNLTQKEFADKLGVTFQAVSKWENGKNIPDIAMLKKISEDFNINLEEIITGKKINNKSNKKKFIILGIGLIIIIGIFLFIFFKNEQLNLKVISTNSNDFEVNGCVVFNDKVSSIYVSNIEYLGNSSDEVYKEITFILYEKSADKLEEIDNQKISNDSKKTFRELIEEVDFSVTNYEANCKTFESNDLYVEAKAITFNGKTTTFQIPFSFDGGCVCEQ